MSRDGEQIQEPSGGADPAGERAAPAGEGDSGSEVAAEPLGPVLTEALGRVAAVLRGRGRAALESGARRARRRMDLYQSRRDLDKLYQKLGREVLRLVEAGEIDHPGLIRGVERVRQQERAVEAAAAEARQQAIDEAAEARATVPRGMGLASSGEGD